MIIDGTTRKLQIVLAAGHATADSPWSASIAACDSTGTPPPNGTSSRGNTNGTSPVDVIGVNASGKWQQLVQFALTNKDTASITVTVQVYDSSGPTTTAPYTTTLAVGDTLQYSGERGWFVTSATAIVHTPFGAATATVAGILTLPTSCQTIKATGTEDFLGMTPGSLTPGDLFILRIAAGRTLKHMGAASAPAVPFHFGNIADDFTVAAGAIFFLQLGEGGAQWDLVSATR